MCAVCVCVCVCVCVYVYVSCLCVYACLCLSVCVPEIYVATAKNYHHSAVITPLYAILLAKKVNSLSYVPKLSFSHEQLLHVMSFQPTRKE